MSSSGWPLKHVEVDFIFIVSKVLIKKSNYSNTNIKNNQSFFAKVEIVRILLFHFLVGLLPKIVQSPDKVSF